MSEHDDETTCPECLEPYVHGEDPGAVCLECAEYFMNEQAQFEDELDHALQEDRSLEELELEAQPMDGLDFDYEAP